MMTYTVLRNNNTLAVSLEELQADDLVQAADQNFYPITAFPTLQSFFPQLPTPTSCDFLHHIRIILIICICILLIAGAAAFLLTPQYNDEPLTQKDRKYIRERDGEICFYCLTYAPRGHVDHRVSRANGGSNDYDNLTWACARCNCSKGAMNDTEFLALFQ